MVDINPLDYPITYRPPGRIAPSAWIEHVPFGMFLVDILSPNTLVELGTHYGVSYCAFCQAAQAKDLDARFYAIDTWTGDAQSGFYGPEVLADLKDYHDPLYGGFSRLVQGTFDDALQKFEDGSIDLIHLDGLHTFEAVKHDFEAWLPKVSAKGVVLLHDTNVREGEFGVWKLWKSLCDEYEHFEFIHGHGLGILFVGEEVPESVLQLSKLEGEELQDFREFFFQLGAKWQREFELSRLRDQTSQQHDLIGQLQTLTEENAQLENERRRAEDEKGSLLAEKQILRNKIYLIQESARLTQEQNEDLLGKLAEVEQSTSDLRSRNAELVQSKQATEHDLAEATSELVYMSNTRSWRLIARWWGLRDRLLPSGSSRLRAYYLLRTSLESLVESGPLALAKKTAGWIRGVRKYHPKEPMDKGHGDHQLARSGMYPGLDGEENIPYARIRRPKILYVATKVEFVSKKYRVFDIKERLDLEGVEMDVMYDVHLTARKDLVPTYDIVVFARLPMTPQIREIIDEAREHNTIIAFEVDDFVFDQSVLPFVDAIKVFSEDQYNQYVDGVRLYRELMEYCDYVICSTDYLASLVEDLGMTSFVIENGINEHQVRLAEQALAKKPELSKEDDLVRIGYQSGTKTHRADFEVVVPALRRIMAERPDVRLCVRGYLDIPASMKEFEDRIQVEPFVHWKDLVSATADLDIAIAPLEIDNPFTEAKSPLKYFEAAIVEVPVVASSTAAYSSAIENGKNGFLASDVEAWYQAITELVSSPELRNRIGKAARQDALNRFTSQALAGRTISVFRDMLGRPRRAQHVAGRADDRLSITWVTSSPFPGSGGHRSVFRTAELLRRRGHSVKIHLLDDGRFDSSAQIADFIDSHFMETNLDYELGTEGIQECDALIATTWQSAHVVHGHRNRARQAYYFVQDFEPYFFQMGNDYVMAEQTYRLGLRHITLGPWLTRKLRDEYGAVADYFQFPIAHDIYNPAAADPGRANAGQKKVLFFARPEMPRRCYPLGLQALSILHRRLPQAEIVLFGSTKIDSRAVPFPHTNVAVINDVRELAKLLAGCDVGLVFSTTNPSWMPLEMMACGLPVVELDNEINRIQFGQEPRPVSLVNPDPFEIASAVEELLEDENERGVRIQDGLEFVKDFPTLAESIDRIETLLREGLAANA